METTASDGKNYLTAFYNLDAIIAVELNKTKDIFQIYIRKLKNNEEMIIN
jgi:hypothetical protein